MNRLLLVLLIVLLQTTTSFAQRLSEQELRSKIAGLEDSAAAPYYAELGAVLSGTNRIEEALEAYRKSYRFDPDPERGANSLLQAGYGFLNAGLVKPAHSLFQELAGARPETVAGCRALEGLAEVYLSQGNTAAAEEALTQARARWLKQDKPHWLAQNWLNWADLRFKQQDYRSALEDARASLKIERSSRALLMAGQALQHQRRLEEALTFYQDAVKVSIEEYGDVSPWTDSARSSLALCLTEAGDFREAIDIYKQVPLERMPERPILLAFLYKRLGWSEEALQQITLALQSAEHLDAQLLAQIRLAHFSILIDLDKTKQAELALQDLTELPASMLGDLELQKARLFRIQGKLEAAQQSIERSLNAPGPGFRAPKLMQRALIYRDRDEHTKARETLTLCLTQAKAELGEEHPLVADSLLELARLQATLGQAKEALVYLQKVLNHRRRTLGGQHQLTAACLVEAGLLYRITGQADLAEPAFRESERIYTKLFGQEHIKTLEARTHLGSLLSWSGKSEGIRLLEESLALVSRLPQEQRGLVTSIACQTLAMHHSEDPQRAGELLARGLPYAKGRMRYAYLITQAQLQTNQGEYGKAKETTLSLLDEPDDPAMKSIVLTSLASLYRITGEPETAARYYRQALDENTGENIGAPIAVVAHWGLASHYLNIRQPDRAWLELEQALTLEKQVMGDRGALALTQSIHATAVETLLTLRKPEKAFTTADDSLARSLKRVVLKETAGKLAGIPQEQTSRLGELEKQIRAFEKAQDLTDPLQQGRRAQFAQLAQEQAGVQKERRELLARIAQDYPSYAELLEPTPLDFQQAQSQLEGNEAVLLYFLGPRSYLFLLTADELDVVELENASTLNGAAAELSQALGGGVGEKRAVLLGTEHLGAAQELEAARVHLGKLLIDPAKRWKEKLRGKSLVIVPTQKLWMVPFECLPALEEQAYLVQEHSLSYAHSLSLFLRLRQTRKAKESTGQSAIVIGAAEYGEGLASLPYAAKEAQRVATHFEDSQLFTGRQATEQAYSDNESRGDADFVHFATHGVLGENPALLFTPNAGSDGRLEMGEILAQDIRARVVTLSACSSGRGDLRPGEGVMGLSRAFLHAGASTVIVSLWSVNDRSTAQLMSHFYENLGSVDPSKAMREAQLKMIQSGATLNQWAPFVLVGLP